MKRRPKPPRKTRSPKRPRPEKRAPVSAAKRPRAQKRAPPSPAVTSVDPLADARIRPLLDRYCKLARVKQTAHGADLAELTLPKGERAFFRDRESLRLAFSLDALERDSDAEIAVLGSPFLSQLLEAIRARAARLSLGLIAPGDASDPKRLELPIPVRDGTVRRGKTKVAVHPVGRLHARVVLRAGAGVEEAVVESDVYDLSSGARVDDDLAGLFQDLEAGQVEPADPSAVGTAQPVPAREPEDLLRLLLSHLRDKSLERVAARRAAAEQALATELGRLDRYFESILKDQSDPEAVGTVTALAERRRAEEIRRSQVRAIVHPLQLVEAAVLMQRAEWRLESARGHKATFTTQRSLSGSAGSIACPHCGRPPAELVVCKQDHCGCDVCSHRCSVCAEEFCAEHGIAECRVDQQPACAEHVHVCPSCRLEHCTAHEGVCAVDGHAACTTCLEPCASCGKVICNRHAEQSHADAPKGRRRLCTECLRYCEGGSREPVGKDEVAECASCGKQVCTEHSAVCAVDEQVHCSQHLRRAEKSRRMVCARHRAGCAEEVGGRIFASDEVGACGSCGKLVCAEHSGVCVEDGLRHCLSHLAPLVDANGSYGCVAHRKTCHLEARAYTPRGVEQCPVCGKDACAQHRAPCAHCGRQVCIADRDQKSRHCATCKQLAVIAEPPADVLTAARVVTGSGPKSRALRMARDHSHVVVELDLGLKRKTVFTLRHGETKADRVVKHTLLGSKQRE